MSKSLPKNTHSDQFLANFTKKIHIYIYLKTQGFLLFFQVFDHWSWFLLPKNVQKRSLANFHTFQFF